MDPVEIKLSMRLALQIIAEGGCERLTSGPGSCWRQPWSPLARYGADCWCAACIALKALEDERKPVEKDRF